jgi:hypothetical protein
MRQYARARQLAWFVGLYLFGVGAVLLVAGLLRLLIPH